MTVSSSDCTRPTPLTEAEAETRTAKLVAEMIQRWRQGERPVVLKLTARDGWTASQANEHLSLARLQHTHIVPLYSVQDYPARGLRGLCMPYFGGATLAQLLEALRAQPPSRRSGRSLLEAL